MIQNDLPGMPAEIIDIWLEPLSRRKNVGWPPTAENDWRFILGRERDLTYLQSLKWKRVELEIKPSLFIKRDINIIVELYHSYVLEETTIYSLSMSDGKDRFQQCCSYLKKHGVSPKPVILEQTTEGIHVFDGYHRLCAFFYLYGYFKIENDEVPCLNVLPNQEVWLSSKHDL